MKRILFLVTMMALIFPLPGAFAGEEEKAAAPTPSQEKKQYEQSMEKRLSKVGKELDEIKAKTATMTEQARQNINQYIADAEKKHEKASQKLRELRKESVKSWKRFASEMNAAAEDFEKAFDKAKAHFKE